MNCRDICCLKTKRKRRFKTEVQRCFEWMLNPAEWIAIIHGINRLDEEWNYYCFEIAPQVSLYQNPNEHFFKKYPIKPYPTENQV